MQTGAQTQGIYIEICSCYRDLTSAVCGILLCASITESALLTAAQGPLQTRPAGSLQLQINSGLLATPQAPPQSHPRPLTALPPEAAQNWMQSACSFCVYAGEV